MRYSRFSPDGSWKVYRHPDTGISWEGQKLPNWEYCKEGINRICKQLSSLDYLGLDIIITEDGIKLCEINSHPDLDYAQLIGKPALSNPDVRRFFEHKGLWKYNGKDFYQAYIESQE